MNRHTFQDTVSGKKKSLVEDLDLGDEEEIVGRLDKEIEGEEEEDYSERVSYFSFFFFFLFSF